MTGLLAPSASWLAAAAAFAGVLAAVFAADRVELEGASNARRVSVAARLMMATGGALTAFAAVAATSSPMSVLLIVALAYFAAFDIRFFAVPVWPILACTGLGFVLGQDLSADDAPMRLLAAATGLSVFVGLDWSYRALRGRSGLGRGDALIAALIGAWLSWEGLAWSVAVGASLGVAFIMLRGRPEEPAPFAPALAAGAAFFLALGLER